MKYLNKDEIKQMDFEEFSDDQNPRYIFQGTHIEKTKRLYIWLTISTFWLIVMALASMIRF